jgi:acylglycerol lipase
MIGNLANCRHLENLMKRLPSITVAALIISLFLQYFAFAQDVQDTKNAQVADPNDLIFAVQDGKLSDELHMPLYEWYPKKTKPTALLLAIHGLTLHGNRYNIIGKAFAAYGFYACACDMRGFGRCYTDDQHKFCIGEDCKRKVNYDKSYADIVQLAKRLKEEHPNIPLFAMGESLGTSVCIRLAAEHPELVDALILSGPAVEINPRMVLQPKNFAAGLYALLIQPQFRMQTKAFVKNLVSNDPDIIAEMLDDPLCRKRLTIAELLKTNSFVSKSLKYTNKIKHNEPVLILQGSKDRCMVPDGVIRLCKNIPSSDQTLRWLDSHGHLLLETAYLRPATIGAVSDFIEDHQADHEAEAVKVQLDILKLGAKPCRD